MLHHAFRVLTIAGAVLLAHSTAAPAAPASRQPKVSVKCIAPGSSKPVACAAVTGETLLSLKLASGEAAPSSLIIRNSGNGATARLQPKWFLDHGLTTKVRPPASLCEGARSGQTLQFEIQVATSDVQNADSVGYFQMRC